jgi:hypothetical protein
MYETNRRSLLKTTGAGAGIALGAGTTGVAASELSSAQQAGVTFTAEATSGSIGVNLDDVANRSTFGGGTSPPVAATIEGAVTETGRWTGQDGVAQPFTINAVPLLLALNPGQKIQDYVDQNIANGGLEQSIDNAELEPILELVVGVVDDLNFSEALVTELFSLVNTVAGIDPTLLSFVIDDDSASVSDLLVNPTVPLYIDLLNGIIETDFGSLPISTSSTVTPAQQTVPSTRVVVENLLGVYNNLIAADDPNTDAIQDIPALEQRIVNMVSNLDIGAQLSGTPVPLIVKPVTGQFDPRQGGSGEAYVSAEISALKADVEQLLGNLLGGVIGVAEGVGAAQAGGIFLEIPLSLDLESADSGALTGSYGGPTTLVDNEFVAGLERFDTLAAAAELQSVFDGLVNLIKSLGTGSLADAIPQLIVQLVSSVSDPSQFQTLGQELADFINSFDLVALADGNFNEGLVNLDETVRNLIPDQPGDHALELDFNFSFDSTLDLDPGAGQPFDMPGVVDNNVQQGPPTDPGVEDASGNVEPLGLFGDVNGDGNVNVADVQALFQIREDINRNGKPELYNFSGVSQTEVDIFDVQALFYFAAK